MGVLQGIRVLDLGVLVQAPQAAATLHDLGADVIKVELPEVGDISRGIPVSRLDDCAARSTRRQTEASALLRWIFGPKPGPKRFCGWSTAPTW